MPLQPAWNPYTKRDINKIDMVQRRAARFVFNDYSRASHVSPMIDRLGWDNLQQRRLPYQATMFYKIYQGLIGISFPDVVCPLTRASRLPNICPYRQIQSCVNVYKFSFYPRTIVTWNHIPFNNLCQSTPSFKTFVMPSIKSLHVTNYHFQSFVLYYVYVRFVVLVLLLSQLFIVTLGFAVVVNSI